MSPPKKITATRLELRNLAAQGWTRREIGNLFGTTPSAVSHIFIEMGESVPKPRYKEFLPWRIRIEHAHDPVAERLRWHEHRVRNLLDGKPADEGMKPWQVAMADSFLEQLEREGVVVDYHPARGFFKSRVRKGESSSDVIRRPRNEM